jgi:hypothetical protein
MRTPRFPGPGLASSRVVAGRVSVCGKPAPASNDARASPAPTRCGRGRERAPSLLVRWALRIGPHADAATQAVLWLILLLVLGVVLGCAPTIDR